MDPKPKNQPNKTEQTERQRMDDDGGPLVQPTLTDIKPHSPQPGAPLPPPQRAQPQTSPNFGDQEREDPRRITIEDAPSLQDKGEAGPDRQ